MIIGHSSARRGFTLIELLVVVAIIGILSAVVLASLSTARTKANDAKIAGQIASVRNAAEIYYSSNGNYGPATAVTSCTATNGMFVDTSSGMNNLTATANYPSSTTLSCGTNAGGTTWAVQAQSTSGTFFCSDSTGASKSATASMITPSTDLVC